jgi:hypothetical protein
MEERTLAIYFGYVDGENTGVEMTAPSASQYRRTVKFSKGVTALKIMYACM